ncbi:MAG: Alanine-tRNA ligase [candidate division WWE3 bacterium GW2011_GWC1_41_7]|nr:MAG: Alanine-tRNA ligase [candidate division WWE3 bacterium GW2011_GWC1_41_7]
MTSQEILEKYINFYTVRGHRVISNVSLVPENDPTLLYVNSGMFPLVPYLSGESHPMGKRLVNVQRALRFFEDLENIGITNRHTTAFHMIGNWSLGDYFKDEQLPWAYEFLIELLGLDPHRMFATVFEGDEFAPKDT